MSALSDYLEQKLLDHVYNGVTLSPPSQVWLALHTADPTDAGSGTEVSGGSYARVRIYANGGGTPAFNLAVTDGIGKAVTNANDVTFPTATVPWGTITHVALRDASTGGNLLHYGPLDEAQTVGTGGIFKIAAGSLKLRLE
jgi:hypothetical protein